MSQKESNAIGPESLDQIAIWELFDTSWARLGTLDDYLEIVIDRCARWFSASGASIFLEVEGSPEYALAAKGGTESSVPDDATVVPGVGIAGIAVEQREPILVDDPKAHPLLKNQPDGRKSAISSALVIPLVTPEGHCLGVLNLARRGNLPQFERAEFQLAQSLAGHIALAVANGRLLSKLRRSISYTAELHRRLDTIIENLAVGIVVFRRNCSISHMNPAAHHLAPEVELNSTSEVFVVALPASLRASAESMIHTALSGESRTSYVEDPSGHDAWSLTGSPLPDGGATLAIQDASEQRRINREMDRVKRLAEIGQMTAAIAHEIRNPLAAMRGAAQVIQSDPEHAIEMAKIIEDEVKTLNDLCSEFLDFARPLDLNLEPVSLTEIGRRVCELHQTEFDTANVELEFVENGTSNGIRGDRRRLEQVLRNLILNALQASSRGGKVRVIATNQQIVVEDTGSGMEQEVVDQLFTPFFTTKANGTGLGLSTTRKIVDAHSGGLNVESVVGQGTRITVQFERMAA